MSLGISTTTPFDLVHVALDLETTGLQRDRDTIIEVGAVKFRGEHVIDTFQTLVNPGRNIPDFIQRLTGIKSDHVANAPFFSSVAAELRSFIEAYPVIGHNVQFDLGFLASHNLKLENTAYDTWDLASALLPHSPQYSLAYLSDYFNVKLVDHHRALADASATHQIFLMLLRRAEELDPGLMAHLVHLAARSKWAISYLLSGIQNSRSGAGATAFGLTGLDLTSLSSRLKGSETQRSVSKLTSLNEDKVIKLLGTGGPFSHDFAGFELRKEQEEMLAGVTRAIYRSHHLAVEGGTGVGKSIAYLLPAVLFAVSKGQRVVVSTNTINLQEQLLRKDIPALLEVFERAGLVEKNLVNVAVLKGRNNYLCLHRWNYLGRIENPTVDDARLLSKTAIWLQDTVTGDRGEINLTGRDAFTWSRVSAGEKGWCPGLRDSGPCFLRTARERADQAHIVVVNHALLVSDLVLGGSLIPDYQYLVVDEAHHLEDEATRQLGSNILHDNLDETLELQGRLSTQVLVALGMENLSSAVRREGKRAVSEAQTSTATLRGLWALLWASGERFLDEQRSSSSGEQVQVLIDAEARQLQSWREITLAWNNLEVQLIQASQTISRLQRFLESTPLTATSDQPALAMEAGNILDSLENLRSKLGSILGSPDAQTIHWVARNASKGDVSFHTAPLDVGPILAEGFYNRKECVVMTSATLSTDGSFDYFKRRTGLPEESEELLVGSPFDYQKAALLLIPGDMPAPNTDNYVGALARVLIDLGRSLDGRTMALFTSHSSLRAVANRVRPPLQAEGIQVLAQGIDGQPRQLISRFTDDPRSILLGTSSFWEGVDLPNGVLQALVLTRLPFQVPTDPVVKARSEQYQDPFKEYSIPQAVLRFRQGIGRLIRRKGDKGAIIVLDQRITGRSYGKSFLKSIPPCTLKPSNLSTVGPLVAQWVGSNIETLH